MYLKRENYLLSMTEMILCLLPIVPIRRRSSIDPSTDWERNKDDEEEDGDEDVDDDDNEDDEDGDGDDNEDDEDGDGDAHKTHILNSPSKEWTLAQDG